MKLDPYPVLCLERGITAILTPLSLKKRTQPGPKGAPRNLLISFAVYYHFRIKCNLIKGSNLDWHMYLFMISRIGY